MSFPFHLSDYVKRYDNFFNKELCSSIVKKIANLEWKKHEYYTENQSYFSYDNDFKMSYDNFEEKKIINESIQLILHKYIFADMPDEFTWFKHYNGYSNIRFNRYDANTQMRPHCDHIHDLFDGERKGVPVLSILGLLNDDYTGGDFIMWGNQKIDIPQGTIIVFPSNFMFPHCVTPVLRGTRYSFVSWAW